VWHVLSKEEADRFADPQQVARMLIQHAYRLGRDLRPDSQTVGEYVRQQLDRLGLGADLTAIRQGRRTIPLPPSRLCAAGN
jgi:hypothetical protein